MPSLEGWTPSPFSPTPLSPESDHFTNSPCSSRLQTWESSRCKAAVPCSPWTGATLPGNNRLAGCSGRGEAGPAPSLAGCFQEEGTVPAPEPLRAGCFRKGTRAPGSRKRVLPTQSSFRSDGRTQGGAGVFAQEVIPPKVGFKTWAPAGRSPALATRSVPSGSGAVTAALRACQKCCFSGSTLDTSSEAPSPAPRDKSPDSASRVKFTKLCSPARVPASPC